MYPNIPENRMIVNGVDLYQKYGVVVADGYDLGFPSVKTYVVDIPGGNGKLDLTEALIGDTTYGTRKQTFTLYVIDPSNYEDVKTRLTNRLHGREYDYQLTFVPGYTWHGRFTINSETHKQYANALLSTIKITIEANPYKMKDPQIITIDAVGGIIKDIKSGRLRVRPSIDTSGFLRVIYDNKVLTLQQGTWTINDLLLKEGSNKIYFCSYDIRNLKWSDLINNEVTWGGFKTMPLFEWYKSNGDGTYVLQTWATAQQFTWQDKIDETWADQMYYWQQSADVRPVYIKHDWGDL